MKLKMITNNPKNYISSIILKIANNAVVRQRIIRMKSITDVWIRNAEILYHWQTIFLKILRFQSARQKLSDRLIEIYL